MWSWKCCHRDEEGIAQRGFCVIGSSLPALGSGESGSSGLSASVSSSRLSRYRDGRRVRVAMADGVGEGEKYRCDGFGGAEDARGVDDVRRLTFDAPRCFATELGGLEENSTCFRLCTVWILQVPLILSLNKLNLPFLLAVTPERWLGPFRTILDKFTCKFREAHAEQPAI